MFPELFSVSLPDVLSSEVNPGPGSVALVKTADQKGVNRNQRCWKHLLCVAARLAVKEPPDPPTEVMC